MHAGLLQNGRVVFLDKVENYSQIKLPNGQFAYSAEYDPATNKVVGLTYKVCMHFWLVRLTLKLIGNIDKCILFWRGFLSWWAIRFNRWQCPSYFHWSHSRRRFQGYSVFKPFRVGRIQKWTAMEWAGQPNFHGTLVRLCSDHAG